MLEKKLNLSLFCLGLLVSLPGYANNIVYWADAYDLNSGRLVYREKHEENYISGRPTKFTVTYYDTQRRFLASKSVDFNNSPYDPDINLQLPRYGYHEFSRFVGGNRYNLGVKDSPTRGIKTTQLKVPRQQVVDNGFDVLIKDNFNALLNNKTLHIKYIAPARLDYYRFRIKPVSRKNNILTIKIESDIMLIRWLAKPIIVEYDINKRRMLTYKGITNIPKSDQTNHRAKLVVRYPS